MKIVERSVIERMAGTTVAICRAKDYGTGGNEYTTGSFTIRHSKRKPDVYGTGV